MRRRMSGVSHLAQLEHERVGDVLLLRRRLADVELAGLAVVVGEALGPEPALLAARRARGNVRNPLLRVLARSAVSAGHEFGS